MVATDWKRIIKSFTSIEWSIFVHMGCAFMRFSDTNIFRDIVLNDAWSESLQWDEYFCKDFLVFVYFYVCDLHMTFMYIWPAFSSCFCPLNLVLFFALLPFSTDVDITLSKSLNGNQKIFDIANDRTPWRHIADKNVIVNPLSVGSIPRMHIWSYILLLALLCR